MKTNTRRTFVKNAPTETPEALRARLAVFGRTTRVAAARRKLVAEPSVSGAVFNGRRVRVTG
ncbi:hypothetical protein [Ralstonia pseudosolanacearum]|uniref:Uncharacterized protein n=1 Tax=Ralstonia pseudosolanacearum TaxID=1310165 RepID=A0A454TM60_9RALS|nr:hypothetical protein [Ralstonia pseudosolanacearum]RNM03219.1 hypothetical protein EGA29_19220 [Ralstonia pseudosolanacearum]